VGAPIEVQFVGGDTVTLGAGKDTIVSVRIRAQSGAEAASYIIDVVAAASSTSADPFRVTITYEIPAIHAVDVKTNTGQDKVFILDADVGSDYDFTIEVFNDGNIEDTYGLSITSDDPSMASWFTFQDTEITIAAGKSQMALVTASIPFNALAGEYDFGVLVKSQSVNVSATLDGTIEVATDRYVTISTDVMSSSVDPSGGTGGAATFTITVHNDGNVQESVTFDITYPNTWGPPKLTPETVTVAPGKTAEVLLEFLPSSIPAGADSINAITVTGRYGNSPTNMLSLTVYVLKPDVDVKDVVLSDYNPADEDVVDVTVTLKNTGQVDATGLTIVLLVNEIEVAQVTGQSVPANGERDVLLNWIVDEDPGSIVTMKVRIPQIDLTYTVAEPITIKEEDSGYLGMVEGLGFIYLIGMGLLLGLLLGILLMLVVRGSYKRRLEATRAAGMAEGMALADEEEPEGEGAEEEMEEEEADGDMAEGDEEATEEDEPEEDEAAEPVTVQCPKCETLNVVTTSQRPVEFRCEKCNRLLRLSR
jgi:hypothetical protein